MWMINLLVPSLNITIINEIQVTKIPTMLVFNGYKIFFAAYTSGAHGIRTLYKIKYNHLVVMSLLS